MDNLNSKPQIEIKEIFKNMNKNFTKIMNNLVNDDFNKINENENLTNELLNNFKKISDFTEKLKNDFQGINDSNKNKMDIDDDMNNSNNDIFLDRNTCHQLKEDVIKDCIEIEKKVKEQETIIKEFNNEYLNLQK